MITRALGENYRENQRKQKVSHLLEYLKIYAQKAYREITSIINNPGFLFSNDPEAMGREASCNYYYIHGFTRLIKHNRITNDRIVEAFKLLEDNIEIYLRKHYRNKKFIYYLNADALVPAFTLSVLSYHKERQLVNSVDIDELVDWFKSHACFDGLKIVEPSQEELSTEIIDDGYPDSTKTYCKIIET